MLLKSKHLGFSTLYMSMRVQLAKIYIFNVYILQPCF